MSIPNMMSDEKVFAESLSYGKLNSRSAAASIESVTQEISHLLSQPDYRVSQRRKLLDLASRFAKPGASNAAARIIMTKLIDGDAGTLPIDEPTFETPYTYRGAA